MLNVRPNLDAATAAIPFLTKPIIGPETVPPLLWIRVGHGLPGPCAPTVALAFT
jgi:hypothetical protein